jgi:outer membrane protein OmpA-like peptidoglycan-associated protein
MTRWQTFASAVASLILASGITLCLPSSSPAQQRPTEADIVNALKPPPEPIKTRGLTTSSTPRYTGDQRVLAKIRTSKTRQLTATERAEVADIARSKPSIDLEVYFDYNSSEISPSAGPDLRTLGKALTNAELRGNVFLIAGHTDAKGGTDFNQKLSERRAVSVKKFLQENYDIPDDSLVTAGYGREQLKNSSDPYASENRRVQIVNLEKKEAARR